MAPTCCGPDPRLRRFSSMSYCWDLLTNHLRLLMLMIHLIQGPYFSIISMMFILKMTKKLLNFLKSSESIGLFQKGIRVAFYSFDFTVFIINWPTAPKRKENVSRSSRSSRCPPTIQELKLSRKVWQSRQKWRSFLKGVTMGCYHSCDRGHHVDCGVLITQCWILRKTPHICH